MKARALLLAVGCAALCGCTVSRFASRNATGGLSTVTSYTVAWPWCDGSAAIRKALAAAGPTNASVSVDGLSTVAVGNTNTQAFLLQVVSQAVQAAVTGAVKGAVP